MRRRKTRTHSKAVHAAGHPDLFWERPRALTSGVQRCVLVCCGRNIVQDRNHPWFVGNEPNATELRSSHFVKSPVWKMVFSMHDGSCELSHDVLAVVLSKSLN